MQKGTGGEEENCWVAKNFQRTLIYIMSIETETCAKEEAVLCGQTSDNIVYVGDIELCLTATEVREIFCQISNILYSINSK